MVTSFQKRTLAGYMVLLNNFIVDKMTEISFYDLSFGSFLDIFSECHHFESKCLLKRGAKSI